MIRAWQLATSRPVLGLCLLAALLVALGECRGHREENRAATAPVVARDTPAAAKMERAPLSASCPEVTKLVPNAKERKRIEREFGLRIVDDADHAVADTKVPRASGTDSDEEPTISSTGQGSSLLGIKRLPALPYGGEAAVTIPHGGGEVELTVKPNPRPFLEFRPTYSVSALVGYRDGLMTQRAEFSADWLRAGRIHLVSSAGFERYGDTSGTYALVGAELQF